MKANFIKLLLDKVYEQYGAFSLDHFHQKTDEEGKEEGGEDGERREGRRGEERGGI